MASTTNYNWTTPDDTDLVKDGAAAIRTLGSSIDTSLVDLLGGTTGQVLAKASGTDMDFTWATDASGIPATILDAKGDLIAATADDTASRLAVGTNGQVLTADSAEATGLKWATASSGALTKIVSTTFSSVSSQAFENCFTSTYRSYIIQMSMIWGSSRSQLQAQFYRLTNTLLIDYSGGVMKIPTTGTPTTGYAHSYASVFTIGQMPDQSGGQRCGGQIVINSAQELDSGGYGTFSANSVTQSGGGISDRNGFIGALNIDGNNSCTGFVLSPSTGTFNGTVTVYGLEK
jgi:hypothetical protein